MNAVETLNYRTFTSAVQPPTVVSRFLAFFRRPRTEQESSESPIDCSSYSVCDPDRRLSEYRQLLEDAQSIFVFRNGTAAYSMEKIAETDAVELMRKNGPVVCGTPSADFHVARTDAPVAGFVVRYHHSQIVSFADSDEYPLSCSEVTAGSMIRLSREMDSADLTIVAHYQADV